MSEFYSAELEAAHAKITKKQWELIHKVDIYILRQINEQIGSDYLRHCTNERYYAFFLDCYTQMGAC